MPKEAYARPKEEILSEFSVDPEKGLSAAEAKKRLKQYGQNKLRDAKTKNIWLILFEQFLDPIIYILAAAMMLAFAFSEWLEGFAVLIVILITALIGFFMEWQAIRSVEALQKMVQTIANVLRDSKTEKIRAMLLVPGDIVELEAGDVIPGDARVLESRSFAVKEAVLTGESNQVEKIEDELPEDTPLADRRNMLYKGTIAARGKAKAVIIATGTKTEIGRISELTHEAKKDTTPLEKKLKKLSYWLIWLTLGLALLIVITGFFQGKDLPLMIKTGIALAVAAIPEGLPIVATIALARGMLRLSRRNVVIKKLEAVQTLGETGIICTDKTGTLTENKMSIHYMVLSSGEYAVDDINAKNLKEDKAFQKIIEVAALCNDSSLRDGKQKGDAVEIGLVEFLADQGFSYEEMRKKYSRVAEIPFDAEIKKMSTLQNYEDHYLITVKGALEALLPDCDLILTPEGEKEFTDKEFWKKKSR